jgi:hypothetical protein
MKFWRSRLSTIAAMFMAWHVTAGALVPLTMHVLTGTTTPANPSDAAAPEVCEHHAMPGAICPMHSKPGAQSSDTPGCAMVACDSAATHLFALLAWNGPFEPPVPLDARLVSSDRLVTPNVPVLDLSTSPTTPPPRV